MLSTAVLKRIRLYSGMSFLEILNLPYSFYLLMNKESWIDSWQSTESGREFLKTLWRLRQTSADITAIRNFEQRR